MNKFMLDTDICSYIMREKPIQVLKRFDSYEMEQFCISVVSYAEFIYGIQKSGWPAALWISPMNFPSTDSR